MIWGTISPAVVEKDETAATLAAACRGSSAAAEKPIGKLSAAPAPQNTTATGTSQNVGVKAKRVTPITTSTADARRVTTLPRRSMIPAPDIRTVNIAVSYTHLTLPTNRE